MSQFCWIGKDCDQNGDRKSKNGEKLPYLNWVTKKYFQLDMINMGLCLFMNATEFVFSISDIVCLV